MLPTPINTLFTTAMIIQDKFKNTLLLSFILLIVLFAPAYGVPAGNSDAYFQDSIQVHRNIDLDSVVLTGRKPIRRNNEFIFTPLKAKEIVTVLGETDVIRYIGTLPGVSQGMEGGMAYYVRGSNSGNNRIELDGVPVYGSTHLFGLVSTFHPDIIDSSTFRMGGIPASNGDFLASITSVVTAKPSENVYLGGFQVSPFIASGFFNGIIPRTPLGVVAAARTLTTRPFLSLLKATSIIDAEINPEVLDLFIKLNYNPDTSNTFAVNGYASNDFFGFNFGISDISINWGNALMSFLWEHDKSNGFKMSTLVYANRYYSGQRFLYYSHEGVLESALRMQTALEEQKARTIASYSIKRWVFSLGLSSTNRLFSPAAERVLVGKSTTSNFGERTNVQLHTLFSSIQYSYRYYVAKIGIRQCAYWQSNNLAWHTDIRSSLTRTLGARAGLELTYDKLTQTYHVIEGLPVGWAIDLMIPANSRYPAQTSHQMFAGGYWAWGNSVLSGGTYYKKMCNLIRYINSTNIFGVQNTNWQDEIIKGNGDSYGLEMRIEHNSLRWSGALSYTLSKTSRQYPEINEGMPFPFKFDRRHILNLQAQYILPKKHKSERKLNANLSLSSGHYATLPIGMYKGEELPFWSSIGSNYRTLLMNENSWGRQQISSINGEKMPMYFRLDLGYTITRKKPKYTSEIAFGFFNILNIHNPYLYFYHDYGWKQLSILPLVPSASYGIKF